MVTKQLQKAFIYNQHNCVLKAEDDGFHTKIAMNEYEIPTET
jgi:hypothetical protein